MCVCERERERERGGGEEVFMRVNKGMIMEVRSVDEMTGLRRRKERRERVGYCYCFNILCKV